MLSECEFRPAYGIRREEWRNVVRGDNNNAVRGYVKPALVSSLTVSDAVACFDDNMRVDDGASNGCTPPDDGAGKKNRMTHIRTAFQNHA